MRWHWKSWGYCPFLLTCAFILRASGTYAEDHSADLLLLEGIVQNKLDQLYCSGASVEGRRKLGNEGTQAGNRHCKAAQQHKTSPEGQKAKQFVLKPFRRFKESIAPRFSCGHAEDLLPANRGKWEYCSYIDWMQVSC